MLDIKLSISYFTNTEQNVNKAFVYIAYFTASSSKKLIFEMFLVCEQAKMFFDYIHFEYVCLSAL